MKQVITIFLSFIILPIFGQDALFSHFSTSNGLSSNQFYASIEDSQGRIWFSGSEGLVVLEGFDFRNVALEQENEFLTGFRKAPNGDIWAYSAEGRLYKLTNGHFKEIALSESLIKQIGSQLTNTIAVDKDNNVWVSTIIGGGLFKLNSSSLSIENQSSSISECSFWIKELEPNNFILGSQNEAKENEALLIAEVGNQKLEIPLSGKSGFRKSCFTQLEDGTYLFAAGSELVHFNSKEVRSRLFTEKNIEQILEDSEGKIWIALNQGGLLCFPTGDVSSNNRIEYLGNASVTSLYEDQGHNLWICTNGNGLYNHNLNPTIVYQQPDISDGSDTSETKIQQATRLYQDPNILSLERVIWDSVAPDIFISTVEINNNDTVLSDNYLLQADQNFLKIGYVGSLPGNPGLFQYRYRLSGVDKNWVYTSLNSVTYPMLPPGEYIFEVDAMSKEGIWSQNSAETKFIIQPYYYQTALFKVAVLALVLFLILVSVLLYTKNIRIKTEEIAQVNKRIADLELLALRAQMNPHFMFNTLSSIQHFVSANNTEEALRYLSKFAKLMRVVLENSKRKEITINDEINALKLYLDLEKLRFKNKFDYSIEVGEGIDPSYDEMPSMLIQPYLENAILHGINNKRESGFIKVNIDLVDTTIICTIEDDGVGRKKASEMQKNRSKEHKSQGMNITKDRLAIINRVNQRGLNVEIEDASIGENNGTRVKIYVPFNSY